MALGYDKPLYILAFDHRGSFQKKFFGVTGEPNEEETARISDAKRVIYEGARRALDEGVEAEAAGVLVDEQFGADIARDAKAAGFRLAMPVEKSGQEEFDFQYDEDFGDAHRGVRPELLQGAGPLQHRGRPGDERAPGRPAEAARRLAARARAAVPVRAARPADARADRGRGRRRAALGLGGAAQADEGGDRGAPGRRRRARHLEDRGHRSARGLRVDLGHDTARRARRRGVRGARPRGRRRGGRSLAADGFGRAGVHRVRDRPLDLVGSAEGVRRRQPRARGRREADRRQLPAVHRRLSRGGRSGDGGHQDDRSGRVSRPSRGGTRPIRRWPRRPRRSEASSRWTSSARPRSSPTARSPSTTRRSGSASASSARSRPAAPGAPDGRG